MTGRSVRAELEALEHLTKTSRLERLRQVPVESRLARALPVVRAAVSRERDDLERDAVLGAEAFRDLVPVEAWYSDVEEHDLGLEHPGGVERLVAVRRDLDGVAPDLEQHREALRGIGIVLDHENAAGRGASGRGAPIFGHPLLARGLERQGHGELASTAEPVARRLNPAAVHLDQALDQRESDSEPSLRPRERAVGL